MSGKLDQSLDQIMHDSGSTGRRRNARPRTNRRAAQKAKAAIAAPTGGVQKNTKATAKPVKQPVMAAPRKPAPTGDSKIIISNVSADVREKEMKDYVQKVVGSCKRVEASYGPDGRSRGIFTVILGSPQAATEAVKLFNNNTIDGKKMKAELVVSANNAPSAPAPKSLEERMSKPKSAAKEAKATTKGKGPGAAAKTNGTAQAKGGRGAKKSGHAGRPKKKTADELDAEMMDYFGNEAAPANGTAQPAAATNGAEPVDEVM